MILSRYATDVVGTAAAIAALVYIGRQVGKLATLGKVLIRLPAEHEQLLEATRANTDSISRLTQQVTMLTEDLAMLITESRRT